MHIKKVLAFVLSSALIVHGAFIDTLSKCGKDDTDCQTKLIQKVLHDIAKTGVPELEIPSIDPVELKNINASILDVVDIEIVEGVVKGARNCVVNAFSPNFDKLVATLDITCDITLKGKYKLSSSSPVIKNILGGEELHGEGNGKVKIQQLNLKLEFPYELEERDGEVYVSADRKKVKYTFDVLGNVQFSADNLFLGNKESSESIVNLLNQSWKGLVGPFGKHFVDIAIDFVFDFANKFLNHVSTKHYISDDLHSLVKH